ncbi:hypothetical protein EDD37DRAFT_619183 [Exophiala viscosa]|uniref:uncharacterized protein n=1 Tax=Exophiala viscosa TaxID=2486360 RepID=UPI002193B067|nr:hypothetical protein EDD37DRAFT_619183 [Exophiala viscosa]
MPFKNGLDHHYPSILRLVSGPGSPSLRYLYRDGVPSRSKRSAKDEESSIGTTVHLLDLFVIRQSLQKSLLPVFAAMATTTLLHQLPATEQLLLQLFPDSMSQDKRSPGQPVPFQGEFSFVNKDAGNIDSKDHNAAVSWHVMNRYERWKKQQQAKQLRASANVPVGPLSSPTQQQSQQRSRSTAEAHRRQSAPVRRVPYVVPQSPRLTEPLQTLPNPTATPFGFDPWMAEQPLQLGYPGISSEQTSTSAPRTTVTSVTSTPSTQSGMVEDDPSALLASMNAPIDLGEIIFDTATSSMSPLMSTLIAFAYEVFIPQQWPKESDRSPGAYEIARCWDDTTLISQDTCYANAYLSLLAATLAVLTDDDSLAYQSRYFQGQAMVELRQRVAQLKSPDLVTLKAILKLFSSETLVDNTAVARMHLKMLRNLVNSAGGVILMDSWFREDLLSCDCYFALKYETRPLFPAQEWTPGPLSQPWKARLLSAGVFGDHAAGIDPLIEHPVMKAVVTDLRELFKAREYTQNHDVPTDDQLLRWQQLRKFDCISRLADHYVNLAIYPHLFLRPITQACTCITTALMTAMVLGSPEPVRFGLKQINDLRKKLRESQAERDGAQDRRLRLWALYVGWLAEKAHPVNVSQEAWFESNYRNAAVEMDLSGWEDVKRVMRQFLFSERLHQEIETGRPHRIMDVRQGIYSTSGCSWREPILESNFTMDESEGELMSAAAGKQRADEG